MRTDGFIARHLGLPVVYQQVFVPDSWTRSGGIAFASQHVNLVLGKHAPDPRHVYDASSMLTVDFVPPGPGATPRSRPISEPMVLAMYLNNRAAEALALHQTDAAYAWSREAIRTLPSFLVAYNTLGVVYLQRGLHGLAEQVFTEVLRQEPANTLAMNNLVSALVAQGRGTEAQDWRTRLAAIEPTPPFHYADLGMEALKMGDFLAAKRHFEREIQRDAYAHEFHYWLAVTENRLGNVGAARRELDRAVEHSSTRYHRGIYLAKLETLGGRATP